MIIEQWDLDIEDQSTGYILESILDTVNDRAFSLDDICDIVRLNIEELICRYRHQQI